MSRDEPSGASKPLRGPVKRSPPRKQENNFINSSGQKEDHNDSNSFDYNNMHPNPSTIERKEKVQRSPVASGKPLGANYEMSPSVKHEKVLQIPIVKNNPIKAANEFRHSPDPYQNDMYDQFSPHKQNYSHFSPKTFTHVQEPTELNNFEDRVDDLL